MASKNKTSARTGVFTIKSANEAIESGSLKGTPIELFGQYWIEGEVCCLFSDTNVGKSILAVQIGNTIAGKLPETQAVLYYDFELTDKQFEMRYTSKTGERFIFRPNFKRVELNCSGLSEKEMEHLEDIIVEGIEQNIRETNSRHIIIDNISWLVNMKESPTAAGKLMLRLANLKKQYGLSILVIAHTMKRCLSSPININHLQGSKRFSNFFDSMFVIGQNPNVKEKKYFKQMKVRSGEFIHGAESVETAEIVKDGPWLGFKVTGTDDEKKVLRSMTRAKKNKAVDAKRKPDRCQSVSFINSMIDESFGLL